MVLTLAHTLGLSAFLLCSGAGMGAAQREPAGAGENPVVVMLGTGTPRPELLVVHHNGRRVAADRILAHIWRSFSGPVAIAADLRF